MNSKINIGILFVLLYAGQLIAEPRPEPKYDDKDYIYEDDDDDEYDFVDDTNEPSSHPKYYVTYGRDVNGGKDEPGMKNSAPAKGHITVSDIVAQTGVNPATAYVPLNDGHGTTYLVPSTAVKLFTGENVLFPVDKTDKSKNKKAQLALKNYVRPKEAGLAPKNNVRSKEARSAPKNTRNNVRPGQKRRTNRRQTGLQRQRQLQQQQQLQQALTLKQINDIRRRNMLAAQRRKQQALQRRSFRRRFRVGGRPRRKNGNRNRNRNRNRKGNQRRNFNRRRNGNRRRGNRRKGNNRRRYYY